MGWVVHHGSSSSVQNQERWKLPTCLIQESCTIILQDLDNELAQIMTGLKAKFQQIYRIASIIDKRQESSSDSKHTTAIVTVND
jgi:hypothetical protein